MMWHRRETRRQTEKTKLNLNIGRNLLLATLLIFERPNCSFKDGELWRLRSGDNVGTGARDRNRDLAKLLNRRFSCDEAS